KQFLIKISMIYFQASAVPHFGSDVGIEKLLFRMALGEAEPRSLNPAMDTCANSYFNASQKNAEKLANTTNACEDSANRTIVNYNQQSNSSVTQIRTQLLNLQQNLQRCLNNTDSALFLNCTTATFDTNLNLLDTSNAQAYQTQTQFASNATQVAATKKNCISAAISEGKVQSIQLANEYDACLDKIQYQRETQQVKEKVPVKQEIPVKPQVPGNQVVPAKPEQNFEDMPLGN
ncbi:hypothetical protein KR009_000384, partial [Drosophila setifemur]